MVEAQVELRHQLESRLLITVAQIGTWIRVRSIDRSQIVFYSRTQTLFQDAYFVQYSHSFLFI